MNTQDKIDKAAHELVASVTNFIIESIISAQRNNRVDINDDQLRTVSNLVKQLSDAGYYKNLKTFQETIKNHVK